MIIGELLGYTNNLFIFIRDYNKKFALHRMALLPNKIDLSKTDAGTFTYDHSNSSHIGCFIYYFLKRKPQIILFLYQDCFWTVHLRYKWTNL